MKLNLLSLPRPWLGQVKPRRLPVGLWLAHFYTKPIRFQQGNKPGTLGNNSTSDASEEWSRF
jgi:hypothetical protein